MNLHNSFTGFLKITSNPKSSVNMIGEKYSCCMSKIEYSHTEYDRINFEGIAREVYFFIYAFERCRDYLMTYCEKGDYLYISGRISRNMNFKYPFREPENQIEKNLVYMAGIPCLVPIYLKKIKKTNFFDMKVDKLKRLPKYKSEEGKNMFIPNTKISSIKKIESDDEFYFD